MTGYGYAARPMQVLILLELQGSDHTTVARMLEVQTQDLNSNPCSKIEDEEKLEDEESIKHCLCRIAS